MHELEFGYCENRECLVVIFLIKEEGNHCPDCGRFGRLKDQLKDQEEE